MATIQGFIFTDEEIAKNKEKDKFCISSLPDKYGDSIEIKWYEMKDIFGYYMMNVTRSGRTARMYGRSHPEGGNFKTNGDGYYYCHNLCIQLFLNDPQMQRFLPENWDPKTYGMVETK
jgi:hypothetical protein